MKERIFELKRKRHAQFQEMKTIVEKQEMLKDKGEDLEDSEKNRFDELKESIDDLDQRTGRMEDMMSAEGADEVDDDKAFTDAVEKQKMNVAIINRKNRGHEPKGTMAARFVIGAGLAKQHGMHTGVRYVRDNLEDPEIAKALNATGTSAAGGLLIPQEYYAELIELLWSETVVRSSSPRVIPLSAGQITIPRVSSASHATWIGEQNDISVGTPSFDQIVLNAKKLAGIVPVQNDLIRRSPLAVEAEVRTIMVQDMGRTEDQAFLTGTGSSFMPKGLLNWAPAAAVTTITASPTLNVVNNTFAWLKLQLLQANMPMNRCVLFMNPEIYMFLYTLTDGVGNYFFAPQLDKGTLFGIPFKTSNILPSNLLSNGTPVSTTLSSAASNVGTIAVASTAGFAQGMQVSGTGISSVTTVTNVVDGTHLAVSPNVTMSSGATLTGAYVTSPIILAAMDQVLLGDTLEMFADSSDVASYYDGSTTISSFQRDQTIFRVISECDLAVRHPAAVAVANVFNWFPTNTTPQGSILYATQPATYPASPSLSASPQ